MSKFKTFELNALHNSADARIEIRGTLLSDGRPSVAEVKCYFPLGALNMPGLSIKQERHRYIDSPNMFTTLSFLSDTTNNGEILNLLPLGGTTEASGTLQAGGNYCAVLFNVYVIQYTHSRKWMLILGN